MGARFRWLWRREVVSARRLGSAYRSAGVDPDEVTEFLDQVAGDLARAYTELARVREQNARIKEALRRWQSRQVASARELAGR